MNRLLLTALALTGLVVLVTTAAMALGSHPLRLSREGAHEINRNTT